MHCPVRQDKGHLQAAQSYKVGDVQSGESRLRMRKNARSDFAGNPIENLRRRHSPLRCMGIQGPGNRAPAFVDNPLGKLPRLGFVPEFTGRASGPALPVVAPGRDIRTIGNVPNIVICQVFIPETTARAVTSGGNCR